MKKKVFETKNGAKLFIDLTNYRYKTIGGTPEQVKNALRCNIIGKNSIAKQLASNLLYIMEDMEGSRLFKGFVSFT